MGTIYLRHGAAYVAMRETPYESEDVLQGLLAQHPEMLASPGTSDSSLLLIQREAPVADSDDGGRRWSLDHLYLDARGVPTLVEVKRSSDTRGRREVVAQMLDYAANAKGSFTVELMTAWLDSHAQERGSTGAEVLRGLIGEEDPEAFWQTVATNLDAERFRLIFVSDVIAPELKRIIEFLNSQMTQTEVLAIEVKQYTDERGEQQTIVPRVIGDTSEARVAKRTLARVTLDRARLLGSLRRVGDDAASAADALLDWAEEHPLLEVRWTSLGDIGLPAMKNPLLRLWEDGQVEVRLATLAAADEAWDAARIEALVQEFEAVDGVELGSGRRWPRTRLGPLADPEALDLFTGVVDRLAETLARSA